MYRLLLLSSVLLLNRGVVTVDTVAANGDVPFDANYEITWGNNDHVMLFNQGHEIQLSLDNSSGSGFGSRLYYESGFFQMRIKLHNNDTAGVITTFYLTSNSSKNDHEELDFEFLGNKEGKNVTLQTNIYVNGKGDREQRMFLWFNASADFHTYKILWNQYQIVFYVDDIPIRVLRNNTNKGNIFPTKAMQIQGTIWNGEAWATDGGKTKIDWAHAPFKAHFQGFNVNGCPSSPNSKCKSSNSDWNFQKFGDFNATELKLYEDVRKNYMYYDYCTDQQRHATIPPECI